VTLRDSTDYRFGDLQIKSKTGKLVHNNKIVTTTGRTTLRWAGAPNGSLIAVLSAEKEREHKFNPIPFMGSDQGPARGKRTHDLFVYPEMTRVGEAVILPNCENHDLWVIFTADAGFVVYFDPYRPRAWFVEVERSEGSPR
jgi:hypothetical protein